MGFVPPTSPFRNVAGSESIYDAGKVSLRHAGRMRHLGLGRANKGTRVRLLIHGDDVLVASLDTGEILGEFTIDPTRGYQAKKKGPGENQGPSS